jgi:hypothetical protein
MESVRVTKTTDARRNLTHELGLLMAEEKQEENRKLPGELASTIVRLSEFLDPHLQASAEPGRPARPERWSRRRAAIFILGASLLLWAIIIAAIHYMYHFLSMGQP